MSGIAWMLHDLWYTNIICIDAIQSELTDRLQTKWLKVIIGHGKYKIQFWDTIIYSEATAESEEIIEAKKLRKDKRKIIIIQMMALINFEGLKCHFWPEQATLPILSQDRLMK